MAQGVYFKTKKGHIAHVLADKNISDETANAIERMIDIAYHKTNIKNKSIMQDTNISGVEPAQPQSETPTFGMQLVGIDFNPAKDPKVQKAKELCAQLADLVNENDAGEHPSYLYNLIKGSALREILNAQMNTVKLLTLVLSMETHSAFGSFDGGTFFIDGIPDTCKHDYSDEVFITASGKEIHWYTFKQWASFTAPMRNNLIHQWAVDNDDPIVIGTSECRKCHKIFHPPMF